MRNPGTWLMDTPGDARVHPGVFICMDPPWIWTRNLSKSVTFPNVGIVNPRLCGGDQGAAITRVIFLIFSCKSVSQARPLLSSQAVIHPGDHEEGSRDFQTPGKIRGPWCQQAPWQTWRGCELQPMWRKMEGRSTRGVTLGRGVLVVTQGISVVCSP